MGMEKTTTQIKPENARPGDILRTAIGMTRKVKEQTITAVKVDGPDVWLTTAESARRIRRHRFDKIVVAR